MDSQKVKSLLLFLVLTALFFYFGHTIAREPGSVVVQSEQSTRFLDVIAVLDSIQFDFDFINSLSDTAIKTDEPVPLLSPSDSGRDNPFMRSNPSAFFAGSSGVPTGAVGFDDSGVVREEVSDPLFESIIQQQPLEGVVPPQDFVPVSPEDSSPEQQEDQSIPLSPSPAPVSPSSSSSATLTR